MFLMFLFFLLFIFSITVQMYRLLKNIVLFLISFIKKRHKKTLEKQEFNKILKKILDKNGIDF